MPFCPFFSTNCPKANEGDAGCAAWTHFGCTMIEKPGLPAIYTDGEADPVDVFIIQMFSSNAKPAGDFMLLYALASNGEMLLETDLSKFEVHRLY